MITAWQNLMQDDDHTPAPVVGEWFTVRFSPDPITGEVFNIGVVFVDDTHVCHYRLIDNANAFTCLFGDMGKANIDFLLKVLQDSFDDNHYRITPSPNVFYSQPQTASGYSIDTILDDLFRSMVSLVCRDDEDLDEDKPSNALSTKDLRKKVFGLMKKNYQSLYEKAYVPNPYEIRNPETDARMVVDMPIRYYQGLDSKTRQDYYGSIVSAAYVNHVHRIHHINYLGVTNVTNCCEMLGKKVKYALIIYLPPEDDHKFTKEVITQAENELDRCLYGLTQMRKEGYDIQIDLEPSEIRCLDRAVEFVH